MPRSEDILYWDMFQSRKFGIAVQTTPVVVNNNNTQDKGSGGGTGTGSGSRGHLTKQTPYKDLPPVPNKDGRICKQLEKQRGQTTSS